jgi:hypothetical protein
VAIIARTRDGANARAEAELPIQQGGAPAPPTAGRESLVPSVLPPLRHLRAAVSGGDAARD